MKFGIFGGTFNPVHSGHLRVAKEVRRQLELEKVIFVPSYLPPHKDLADNVHADKRLEIVRIAIAGNPFFDLSSFEVENKGNSYSIFTIEHFRRTCNAVPYFILGQDAFNDILAWYEKDRLFSLTHFVVMSRPHAQKLPLEKIIGKHASGYSKTQRGYINNQGNEIIYIEVTPIDISSSMIRDRCKKGESIRDLVPEKVENYINDERIYL
ncbi:MAG TPA: nicotinate (nicotinamide) nucleotide adenylyltransferase [Deltaproteobacteria bacterium]|nr:nicotinate (nicotinamide) nucleotide adenylyltransferase [Deltaproteobacteria bacterium]